MTKLKRPLCWWCGWETGKRVPDDDTAFCTKRCAAGWAEASIWNLLDLGVGEHGEFEQGMTGDDEEIEE